MFRTTLNFTISVITFVSRVIGKVFRVENKKIIEIEENLRWLEKFWKKFPFRLSIITVLTPICAILTFLFPVYLKTISNGIEEASKVGKPFEYTGLMIMLSTIGILSVTTYAFLQSQRAWVNLRLEWVIRSTVFKKITDMGNAFFTKFRTGDVITRFTDDLEKVSFFACSQIFRMYEALLYIIAGSAYMIYLSPMLAAATLIPIPLFALVMAKSDTRLMNLYDNLQKLISKVNNHLEVCFSGIKVLRTYRRENQQVMAFSNLSEDRKTQEIKTISTHAITEKLYWSVPGFAMMIVLSFGGYLIIKDTFDLGTFLSYMFCLMFVAPRIMEIGWIAIAGRRAFVSAARIRELESTEPDVCDEGSTLEFSTFTNSIEFKDVAFKFNGSEKNAVEGVSFTARRGDTIAFVGPVGSGKTTLVGLIPRLYDCTSGTIKIDGVDIKSYGLSGFRNKIGFVPQEALLFSETIKNNIIFGRDGISDEKVDWASQVSQFSNDLSAFPDGIETRVGHRGITLSGGQKQRLSIARAIVALPEILILDDCSSALDAETEAKLWKEIERELPNTTVFVISHRIASVKNADTIIVMDDGKQVASGTHSELLVEKNSVYRELYQAQM